MADLVKFFVFFFFTGKSFDSPDVGEGFLANVSHAALFSCDGLDARFEAVTI
jgi:hypothetical protein